MQENYVCCTEEYFVDCEQLAHVMDDTPAETIMEQLQKQLKEHKQRKQSTDDATGVSA